MAFLQEWGEVIATLVLLFISIIAIYYSFALPNLNVGAKGEKGKMEDLEDELRTIESELKALKQ